LFTVWRLFIGKQLFPDQTSHATAIQWGQNVVAWIRLNTEDIVHPVQRDLLLSC
jgi:hypothetical protein